jgi:hypothetical protein
MRSSESSRFETRSLSSTKTRQPHFNQQQIDYVLQAEMIHAMRSSVRICIGIVIAVNLSVIGSFGLTANCQADDTEPEMVPEPTVHETHEYNVSGDVDGTPTDEFFVNERWSIDVSSGDVMTLIMVRNITQNDVSSVDYTNNIHYYIGGKLYIAQFMIMELVFKIGTYEIHAPLSTCSDFTLERSQILYDGTVPTLDCSITYEGIQVYSVDTIPAGSDASTVDLTLTHHIRGDWTNTHMKIEALFDFTNTRFFNPDDSNDEYNAGEPFTAEINYGMMLANPEDFRTTGPVIPSGYTNTTLEYNMTLDSGLPLTVSRLQMRDNFTIYNESGARASTGYSFMELHSAGFAQVTHGFPNMTYKDTQSMKSDPEITIYHDRVTETDSPAEKALWIMIPVAAGIAAVGIAIFLTKRRARGSG